jgi:hypothetical protein
MKKLTTRRKRWLSKRSNNQRRRNKHTGAIAILHTQSGQQSVEVGNARPMPDTLCLETDLNGTVGFFERFRHETLFTKNRFSRLPSSKKHGGPKSLRNYYNFVPMKIISPGAALVLAAEFDRINRTSKASPSAIDVEKWDNQVYATLFHLGFFKLLGFSESQARQQEARRPPQLFGLTIMPMLSGDNADVSAEHRAELVKLFDVAGSDEENAVKLRSAVVDAIENVVNHAYDDIPINHRKFIPRRWWISGSASITKREISISIFDQGVSIPFSLPVKWEKDALFAKILSDFGFGSWKNVVDYQAIIAAMALSSSSTKNASRGKGLHKIKEIMSELKGGSLMILSRKGYYKWENQVETASAMESQLLGTYVQLRAGF